MSDTQLTANNTFDITYALSAMFLWVAFGYISVLINCDLKRMILNNPIVMHAMALVAFFFLFTVLDPNNRTSVGQVFLKTAYVYVVFMLMIKSKWYFVMPVLALMLTDQVMKRNVAFKKADGQDVDKEEARLRHITHWINVAIVVLAVVGFLDYIRIQTKEYGSDFSFYKFLFGWTVCKDIQS